LVILEVGAALAIGQAAVVVALGQQDQTPLHLMLAALVVLENNGLMDLITQEAAEAATIPPLLL
jgi:hypothetical protein